MKTVELKYLPGDACYIKGHNKACYIDSIFIDTDEVTYNWYSLTVDYDTGCFTNDAIGNTVFDSFEELDKAFPNYFYFDEED